MAYTIIEVEKKTGVSSHTLRFWAKKVCFHLWRKTIIKSSILVSVMWNGCVGLIGFVNPKWIFPWLSITSILLIRGILLYKRDEISLLEREIVADSIDEFKMILDMLDYNIDVYDKKFAKNFDGFNPQSKQYQKCNPLHIVMNILKNLIMRGGQ